MMTIRTQWIKIRECNHTRKGENLVSRKADQSSGRFRWNDTENQEDQQNKHLKHEQRAKNWSK